MSAPVPGPKFRYYGDWLIHRSTGAFGDFQMQTCINIISNEGARNGWLHQLTDEDIKRILARYKAHVGFWNANFDVIRNELQAFATALDAHHSFNEIAALFDSLPAQRIPPEIVYSYALVKKEVLTMGGYQPQPVPVPFPPSTPPIGSFWALADFTQDEVNEIYSSLLSLDPSPQIRATGQGFCEVRASSGGFTRAELDGIVRRMAQNRVMYGAQVRYTLVQMS